MISGGSARAWVLARLEAQPSSSRHFRCGVPRRARRGRHHVARKVVGQPSRLLWPGYCTCMHGYGGVAMTFFYLLIVMAIGKAAQRFLQLLPLFRHCHAPAETPDLAACGAAAARRTDHGPASATSRCSRCSRSLMAESLMMQSPMMQSISPSGAPTFHVLPFHQVPRSLSARQQCM